MPGGNWGLTGKRQQMALAKVGEEGWSAQHSGEGNKTVCHTSFWTLRKQGGSFRNGWGELSKQMCKVTMFC